eukprot:Sspe_Gene.118597::Locus_112341_Transcript_2_3_Confidence_0.500_Length_450::g.118597::m.118597
MGLISGSPSLNGIAGGVDVATDLTAEDPGRGHQKAAPNDSQGQGQGFLHVARKGAEPAGHSGKEGRKSQQGWMNIGNSAKVKLAKPRAGDDSIHVKGAGGGGRDFLDWIPKDKKPHNDSHAVDTAVA